METFQLAGEGAHVVQMKAIDGNNELGKIKRLVHCMHVAGEYMKKRTRRHVRNEICLGLGLGRTHSPPIVNGKFPEPFEGHFEGQAFGAFGPDMGSFENFIVVFNEAEVWPAVNDTILEPPQHKLW